MMTNQAQQLTMIELFPWLKHHMEAVILSVLVALLGGIVQIRNKAKAGEHFSFMGVIGEMCICVSASLTCFAMIADNLKTGPAVALSSIAAHMGTRFFALADRWFSARIKAASGLPPSL